ncbi:MAG: DNA-3-methyladenine glycosylase 2 family protein [Actinomycetota bacterium]|nr:DNA-3-methyladenine glycosylase 2 family protein [Actinomycetota bacterium]
MAKLSEHRSGAEERSSQTSSSPTSSGATQRPAPKGPARLSWRAATAEVAARDPALAGVIARAGPVRLRAADPDGAFGALVRAIAFQQLAGAAASAIHGRVRALVDGPLTPESVLALPEAALRGAGLSAAKTASIRDLAAHAVAGDVPLSRTGRMPDAEIVARLCEVRGIGPWTAEMFLLFELRRLDVWPVGDLGVRAGWGLAHGLDVAPTPSELAAFGEPLRGVRSVAAWYCWQAVHIARDVARGSVRTP